MKTGRWPRSPTLRYLWVVALAFAAGGGGCVSTHSEPGLKSYGLHYQLKELDEPRPNRVHILRVDFANKAVQPVVVLGPDPDGTGPAEAALTDPRKLADDPRVLAYVNTNPWGALPAAGSRTNRAWFEGQPVDLHGLAVSQGSTRSPGNDHAASVWFSVNGRVSIGEAPGVRSALEVATGFQPVVTAGGVSVASNSVVHPRTAIGANRNGTVMWMVVVDGRQPHYSEGMTLFELGQFMLQLGCWNAVNMDGGGSSIMGLRDPEDGVLRIMNSPSDRLLGKVRIRPLPAILTIQERSHP